MGGKYDNELAKCGANHRPLSPIDFLQRAEDVFPDRVAVIYEDKSYTWKEHATRCKMLASALVGVGVRRGDTVSILAPNTPAMLEVQFGVPMAGGVVNCINSRLDPAVVGFILRHAETRVFLVDRGYSAIAAQALKDLPNPPVVIGIDDAAASDCPLIGDYEYEAFLSRGNASDPVRWPIDEWDAIALNYTSGTTGDPKGVVYHHRGAYLNALGQVINANLNAGIPVYLWTLPLFHCNGWCFPWALAAVGATQICIRRVSAEIIYQAILRHGVTVFCGAPTVLGFLTQGSPEDWIVPGTPIRVLSGGSSPPAPVFRKLQELGFDVVHLYGMTEMHGVAVLCEPQESWGELSPEDRLKRMGRQGVRSIVLSEMMVASPETLQPVKNNGEDMGEIMMRGNLTMKGYLKNPEATRAAFSGGWYRTGDLGVVHPDGYIEVKDRSKDIIISGGENVSSLEIEEVLYTHPAVATVAVVAVPDDKWGETPCALIKVKDSWERRTSEVEFIAYCRERLAGFKCPKHVIFDDLEPSATGKLLKFKLREFAREVIASRSNNGKQ